jgi:hypothetical protein
VTSFFLQNSNSTSEVIHLGTVDNIQKVMTDQLRALPHEDFQHCYREWEQSLRRCVASEVNYFKGDKIDL